MNKSDEYINEVPIQTQIKTNCTNYKKRKIYIAYQNQSDPKTVAESFLRSF